MSSFEAMKADLVARRLLDADGNVTPAGDAWTDALIDELKLIEPPPAPAAQVRWNTRRRAA